MPVLSREEAEAYADVIAAGSIDEQDGFFPRLAHQEAGANNLPAVRIDYDRLKVTAQAKAAAASLPSVPNIFNWVVKTLLCQRQPTKELAILNDLSGTIQPGRLTLLLGPPSCGKTTFLRAIAGQLPKSKYAGTVTYNGHRVDSFCAARTAAFVPQVDTHIPNLTARETAEFSHALQFNHDGQIAPLNPGAISGGAKDDTSASPRISVDGLSPDKSIKELSDDELTRLADLMLDGDNLVDTVMQFFGLLSCKDTMVGNAMMRGISGGERKRLSTVEMLMGRQRVLIMDEISTGLDAATLFVVIRWLRTMTRNLNLTTVISLLQPPPETYALFDDVMIMNEGTIVYHGAVNEAVSCFAEIGFHMPPRKDVATFLQEVTTVRGQLMHASDALRRENGFGSLQLDEVDDIALVEADLPIPLKDMEARLRKLTDLQDRSTRADTSGGPGDGAIVAKQRPYSLGALPMLVQVLKRQGKLFVRDKTLARARIAQCIIMGLLIGGLWFGLEATLEDARTYMSAAFMLVMFMGFGGMPQLAVALQNRSVWFKHRDMNMYTAMSYGWSMGLVQLPLAVIESLIFSIPTYFMIGFSTDGPEYFFIFWLVLMTASIGITSLFRLVGCLFKSPAVANAVAGFALLMLIVNSGFVIVRSAIEPWVVYFYWISPFAYSMRAIVVNEFTTPRWDTIAPGRTETLGVAALQSFDFHTDRWWIWIGIAYNLLFFAICSCLSALALWRLEAPRPSVVYKDKAQVKAALLDARDAKEKAQMLLEKGKSEHPKAGDAAKAVNAEDRRLSGIPSNREQASLRSLGENQLTVGSTLSFTPITVVWKDLQYYVPVPKGLTGAAAANIMPDSADADIAGKKRLLDNITGYAEPGVLTALMGGSGAGKTTMLDVLSGRKNQGVTRGEILVNGHPKEQDTWARVVGYVEQVDVHSSGLTVKESLEFSAGLRLEGDVNARTRAAYVLEVLLVTEMIDIAGNLVGVPGESGLSVEQRRRLSIGVELVANPSVMFLDEPTSGLDGRSAAAVMAAVRNVAANGRTVMVTIHQPSIDVFESFDRLALLGAGGTLIYNGDIGEQSSTLVSYFESVPGVAKLPEGYNPATWMLEVSGGGAKMHVEASDADFPAAYRDSDLGRRNAAAADALAVSGAKEHERLALPSLYATPFSKQVTELTRKMFLIYWRLPSYTVGRIMASLITALLFGITWWGEGNLPSDPELSDVQNILGSLYAGLSFMGVTNMISGIPIFLAERQVMYRERASGMYSVSPFTIATGLVEIPYLLVQVIIFSPIMYFMVDFKHDAESFFLFCIIFMQSLTLYTCMGQLFTYLTPSAPLATLLGALNHFLWNIFNGFLVPSPIMAKGWVWLNYISATTWVIYGLAASQLGQNESKVVVPGYPGCTQASKDACPTVRVYLDDYFGYEYDFRWICVVILIAFIMTFRIAASIAVKVINHNTR